MNREKCYGYSIHLEQAIVTGDWWAESQQQAISELSIIYDCPAYKVEVHRIYITYIKERI